MSWLKWFVEEVKSEVKKQKVKKAVSFVNCGKNKAIKVEADELGNIYVDNTCVIKADDESKKGWGYWCYSISVDVIAVAILMLIIIGIGAFVQWLGIPVIWAFVAGYFIRGILGVLV